MRLSTPAAVASLVVGAFATVDPSSATLALGVACGVLAGAAAASLVGVADPQDAEIAPSAAPDDPPEEAVVLDPVAQALGGGVAVLEATPTALLLLDAGGRIAFANAAAIAEVGPTQRGAHFSTALRAPGLVDAVLDALKDGAVREIAFPLRRGGERYLSAVVAPLPNGMDAVRLMILIEDHTRIRRAEQLHRDFVANASHELKTPLASITGFIETLQVSARDDPAAQERFLGIMAQQAERMRRLVEDLLSLNRIELNEHVPPRAPIDLREVLDAALAETAAAISDGGPPVQYEGFTAPKLVPGDARELTQIFVNLIENALKYGRGKRPVVVSIIDGEPNRVGVSVEDDGPGIAKEHLPRLTERFYRIDVPASRNKGGTGLGLAIVKHAIARHRGELAIDTELGRGSRFTVWLPVIDVDATVSRAAEDAPAAKVSSPVDADRLS